MEMKKRALCQLSPTWDEIAQGALYSQVLQSPYEIAQDENAQGALCSQVLQSRGKAETEETLTAKCTKCNFIPIYDNKVAAK